LKLCNIQAKDRTQPSPNLGLIPIGLVENTLFFNGRDAASLQVCQSPRHRPCRRGSWRLEPCSFSSTTDLPRW